MVTGFSRVLFVTIHPITFMTLFARFQAHNTWYMKEWFFFSCESKKRKRNEAALTEIQQQRKRANQRKKLEKMRREVGAIGGAGHFFGLDKLKFFGGVRDDMGAEQIRSVLKLLALGQTEINVKFEVRQDLEVSENGWNMKFIGSHHTWRRPKGTYEWHLLWIWNKGN